MHIQINEDNKFPIGTDRFWDGMSRNRSNRVHRGLRRLPSHGRQLISNQVCETFSLTISSSPIRRLDSMPSRKSANGRWSCGVHEPTLDRKSIGPHGERV